MIMLVSVNELQGHKDGSHFGNRSTHGISHPGTRRGVFAIDHRKKEKCGDSGARVRHGNETKRRGCIQEGV